MTWNVNNNNNNNKIVARTNSFWARLKDSIRDGQIVLKVENTDDVDLRSENISWVTFLFLILCRFLLWIINIFLHFLNVFELTNPSNEKFWKENSVLPTCTVFCTLISTIYSAIHRFVTLNLIKLCYGGLVSGSSHLCYCPRCIDACYKNGQK
jgi:hypothetical protein